MVMMMMILSGSIKGLGHEILKRDSDALPYFRDSV